MGFELETGDEFDDEHQRAERCRDLVETNVVQRVFALSLRMLDVVKLGLEVLEIAGVLSHTREIYWRYFIDENWVIWSQRGLILQMSCVFVILSLFTGILNFTERLNIVLFASWVWIDIFTSFSFHFSCFPKNFVQSWSFRKLWLFWILNGQQRCHLLSMSCSFRHINRWHRWWWLVWFFLFFLNLLLNLKLSSLINAADLLRKTHAFLSRVLLFARECRLS